MEDSLKENREIIDNYLDTIEKEFNIHCIQRKFTDSYFVFSYEDKSICNFKIKEIPDFYFGVWLSSNIDLSYYDKEFENSKLILFTQPIIHIDKFKPSQSVYCIPVERVVDLDEYNKETGYSWDLYSSERMIKSLRKHKLKSSYKASRYSWNIYDDVNYFQALFYYIDSYRYYYKEMFTKWFTKVRIILSVKRKFGKFKNVKSLLLSYGKRFYPDLHLFYYTTKDISEKENNKLTKIDTWFDRHWFLDISVQEVTEEDFKNKYEYNKNKRRSNIIWKKI